MPGLHKEVPVTAVKKAMDLLSILLFEDSHQQGFGVTELAARLEIPVNSAHNTLKTMMYCGFVSKNCKNKYTVGPNCQRIGANNYVDSDVFKNKLNLVLEKYTAIIHEALVFTTLIDGKRNVIGRSEPLNQLIRINTKIINDVNIYTIVTGKVMIANAKADEYRRVLEYNGDIAELWENYEDDIALIRKQGYCESLDQNGTVRSFAVAFRTPSGTLAAIGCHCPAFRCSNAKGQVIIAEIGKAALELAEKFHTVE